MIGVRSPVKVVVDIDCDCSRKETAPDNRDEQQYVWHTDVRRVCAPASAARHL